MVGGLLDDDKRPKVSCFKEENGRLRYLSTDEERKLLAAAARTLRQLGHKYSRISS
jgi:hypothetical protein